LNRVAPSVHREQLGQHRESQREVEA